MLSGRKRLGEENPTVSKQSSEETERAVGVLIGTTAFFFCFATMEPVGLNRGFYVRGCRGVFTTSFGSDQVHQTETRKRLLMGRLRCGRRFLWSMESGVKDGICGIPALLEVELSWKRMPKSRVKVGHGHEKAVGDAGIDWKVLCRREVDTFYGPEPGTHTSKIES